MTAIVLEPEIDIFLEFLELLFELAVLELQLFNLPVELAQLILEPIDPHQKPGRILLRLAVGALVGVADVGGRRAISLRKLERPKLDRSLRARNLRLEPLPPASSA